MARVAAQNEVDFSRSRGGDTWFDKEWLDGQPWILEAGKDFEAKAETIRTRLYAEAAKAGLGARAKILGNGDVIFQTYELDPEQIEKRRAAAEKRKATLQANIETGKTQPRSRKGKAA